MPVAKVGKKVSEHSTINGKAYSSTNPVIPKGFMAINETKEGHESYWDSENGPQVEEGLIICDGISEFVWIPVSKLDDFARLQAADSTDYRGILYDWTTDKTGETEYAWSLDTTSWREPANLTTSYDNTSNLPTWTKNLFQDSFNKMVASVKEYGGFYVGRYETSLNGNIAQSKAEEIPINKMTWYRMYENALTYSNANASLGITSEMMWGCQWDAMLKFILTGNEADHVNENTNVGHSSNELKEKQYETGGTNYNDIYTGKVEYNDIASNIYDIEGNVREFTQEGVNFITRVNRSGGYGTAWQPCMRELDIPTSEISSMGYRLSIYVDL